MFKLNQDKLKAAIELHNWKHPVSDIARATGYTKAYISMVMNGKADLSADFMSAYVEAVGMVAPGKWGQLFDYIPDKKFPSNHHKYNWLKFYGLKPYTRFSSAGELRDIDKLIEFEK